MTELVCFPSWAGHGSIPSQGLRALRAPRPNPIHLYICSLSSPPPHLQSGSEEQWLRTQTLEADHRI